MEEIFATSLTTDNDNTSIEDIETSIAKNIDEQSQFQPRNRAERRAIAKRLGKKGRASMGSISGTAKKLNYINLIQNLRELNEKKENEENEATED